MAAMLAAIMSSADSALLATSSLISNNILPLLWPKSARRYKLVWARITIPVAGIIAAVIALQVQAIYDLILTANEILLAAVVVPFVLGIWWKKSNRTGALAAMAAGILAWIVSSWLRPEVPGDLLGMAACLLTMLVVTPLSLKIDPPRQLVASDGEKVEMSHRLGIIWNTGSRPAP